MSEHSVKSHLGVDVERYDEQIRAFVPHYEEMIQRAIRLVRALVPSIDKSDGAHVLDLGAGTGALSAAILEEFPRALVTLIDVDGDMLDRARARLTPFGHRATFVLRSFTEPLPRAHAALASLSLHHISEMETKTRVYGAILEALPSGGLFLNLDATVSEDVVLAERTYADWIDWMVEHGIQEPQARKHLADWSREDFLQPLHVELDAMMSAGFPAPECFWRRDPMTIYGARKG